MKTGMVYLKPAEIADLAGLPEDEVREYLHAHPDLFRGRSIGPVRLYAPASVETVKRLAEEAAGGEEQRPVAATVKPAGEAAAAEELEPSPVTLAYLEARDLKGQVARQALEIEALRAELERQRRELTGEIAALEERLAAGEKKTSLIAEWVDYFDFEIGQLKRPFFERLAGKKS
ncbi:hypothetical protein E2N92_07405 [Methanofollis formosanus]|uniref:Uncharacterized protein n=1 Tax=Methanofollis formosanus TaxID=299308 RepID=A0A8G1EG03_9EURY|nr:hypothetical protein [Methanofollis formosanus]QYZ79275.1 hypothetical protein E2N92_07405 [Methanofollis formosanus]